MVDRGTAVQQSASSCVAFSFGASDYIPERTAESDATVLVVFFSELCGSPANVCDFVFCPSEPSPLQSLSLCAPGMGYGSLLLNHPAFTDFYIGGVSKASTRVLAQRSGNYCLVFRHNALVKPPAAGFYFVSFESANLRLTRAGDCQLGMGNRYTRHVRLPTVYGYCCCFD